MGAQLSAGAGELLGQSIVHCGCSGALGFEKSAEAVIRSADIEPWPAKVLIQDRLVKQTELAKKCALRHIPVRDGFNHFNDKIGRLTSLTRDVFLTTAKNLISTKHITQGADDALLREVFDSIDYDGNGSLSVGEWAGGLTVFFQGTQEEKTRVLFTMLDRDGNSELSKGEMKEYLTPLVKAMTPPQAAPLRPLLLQHATEQIFGAVDTNHDEKCSAEEFVQWRKSHNILDELVSVIEAEVYKIWLEKKVMAPKSTFHSDEVRNSIYG